MAPAADKRLQGVDFVELDIDGLRVSANGVGDQPRSAGEVRTTRTPDILATSLHAGLDTIVKKTGQSPHKVVAGHFLSHSMGWLRLRTVITAWDDETEAGERSRPSTRAGDTCADDVPPTHVGQDERWRGPITP